MPVTVPDDFVQFLRVEQGRGVDTALEERRATALAFYDGRPYGDEVEGRSQAVTRDVSEVIDQQMVGILNTFLASGKAVEFETEAEEAIGEDGQPEQQQGPDGQPRPVMVDYGEEATAAVRYLFFRKQNGYQVLRDCLAAGQMEMSGIVKTYVEPQRPLHEPRQVLVDELVEDADGYLVDGLRVVEATQVDDLVWNVVVEVPQPPLHRDVAVPNEYFRVSPDATSLDEAVYVGERMQRSLSDLAKLGYDLAELEGVLGAGTAETTLSKARDANRSVGIDAVGNRTGVNKMVWLEEEYPLYDLNGDGIAERLFVHRVGNVVLSVMEVDEQPYSLWSPFPRQHRLIGDSTADKTMDIQRIRSVLLRQGLDSMYLANAPRTLVSEESMTVDTIDDLLTVRSGGLVRYKGNNPPMPLQQTDTSAIAFSGMEIMAGERESRTGVTRQSQGINPDVLNKMLCIDTPVPMADGSYRRLGEIADGDMIIGSDGRPVAVLKAHKIHNPEKAYRIKFQSGEEILAGGEHLWTIQSDDDRWKDGGRWQIMDTDKLFARYHRRKRPLFYIPRVSRPQTGANINLPVDPYVLGLWLGDGHSWSARITTMDSEIRDYLANWADKMGGSVSIDKHQNSGRAITYSLKVPGFVAALKSLGVMKTAEGVGVKHIPDLYLRASYEQRLELLRGLMDTDGCHQERNHSIFCQKEGPLLDSAFKLIESLGAWPKKKLLKPKGSFKHSGLHYQLHFASADCPFKLSRKVSGWTPPKENIATQKVCGIEKIAVRPMRCLTVEANDGLFCVGHRFTVTHNTASGLAMNLAQAQQIELYVTRNFAEFIVAPMFAKRYRLLRKYGQPFRMKIEGKYRTINPARWPEDIDMQINVGLGTGNKDQKLGARMQLFEIQQGIVAAGGRMVGEEQVYQNLRGFVQDTGLGSPSDYVLNPADLGPPPEQPDPDTAKAQADAATQQAKDQQAHEQAMGRLELQAREADARNELSARQQEFDLAAAREKEALRAELERARAEFEAGLARDRFEFDKALAVERLSFDQELKQRQNEQGGLPGLRPGGDLDK